MPVWPFPNCDWPAAGNLRVDRPDGTNATDGVVIIDIGMGLSLTRVAPGRVLINWTGGPPAPPVQPAQVFVTNVLQSFFNTNVLQTTNVLNVVNVLNVPYYDPSVWTLPQLCGAGISGLLKFGPDVGVLLPGCGWQLLCSDCQPVQWYVPEPPPPVPLPPVLPGPPPGPTFGGPPPPPPPPPTGTMPDPCIDPGTGVLFNPPKTLCLSVVGFSADAGTAGPPPTAPGFWGKGYQATNGVWPVEYGITTAIGGIPFSDTTVSGPCGLFWQSLTAYPISSGHGNDFDPGLFRWSARRTSDGRWAAGFFAVDSGGGSFGGLEGGSAGWFSDVGPPTLPATLTLAGAISPGQVFEPLTLTLSESPCAVSPPGTSGPGTPSGPPEPSPAPPRPCSCCGPGGTVPTVLDVTLQARVAGSADVWTTLLPSFPVVAGAVPDVPGIPGLPTFDCPSWGTGPVNLDGGGAVTWAALVCLGNNPNVDIAPFALQLALAGGSFGYYELPPGPNNPPPLPAPCAPGSVMTLGVPEQDQVDGAVIGLRPGVLYELRAQVTGF